MGFIVAVNPYVDLHDVHFYKMPNVGTFPSQNPLDALRLATSKPFLVGEIGANFSATGNAPNMPGRFAQAQQLAAFRRYTAYGGFAGVLVHKLRDTGTPNQFGMYDSSDAPQPIIGEWAKYPDRQMSAADDAVRYRTHPVVVDNFSRAASSVGRSTYRRRPQGQTQLFGSLGRPTSRLR
jgi:hypothetical protein